MSTVHKKLILREAMWNYALSVWREQGEFSAKHLQAQFKRSPEYVRQVLNDWKLAGYIKVIRKQAARNWYVVTRDDQTLPTARDQYGRVLRETTPQLVMWQSMRRLKTFNSADVLMHSNTPSQPVTKDEAHQFCAFLANAGYLSVLEKAQPGKGKLARYKLVRNTGPLPPREKRVRAVWDDNEQAYTYVAGEVAA